MITACHERVKHSTVSRKLQSQICGKGPTYAFKKSLKMFKMKKKKLKKNDFILSSQ